MAKQPKLYILEHAKRRGLDLMDIAKGAPVAPKTLRRMQDGEEFYASTLRKICDFIGIPYEWAFLAPTDEMYAHAPPAPPGKKVNPIDEIYEDPNATIMGVPLTPSQRRYLRSMIETFKEELKNKDDKEDKTNN